MMTRSKLGMLTLLAVCTILVSWTVSATAAEPDATTIITRMKQALEPPRASAANVTLTLSLDKETSSVNLGMARAKHANSNRLVVVALTPADLRGTAYLVEDGGANQAPQWMWIPAIRRVRRLVTPEAFNAFLNSDFTFYDLGFVDLQGTNTLVGTETMGSRKAYRIQSIPKQQWYYTKIVTLVDAETFLPIERNYYDPAGELWKVQRWQTPVVIDGVPTPLKVSIEDVQTKTRSELTVTNLRYDAPVPDAIVTPEGIDGAAASSLWNSLTAVNK